MSRSVAFVTLGCARNEVDSEELAGRLTADGWDLVDDPAKADIALVNTCGFVAAAKKDSIDAILEAGDGSGKVVAVGCLAERYGRELAAELPEATVLSFDDYAVIGERLSDVLAGKSFEAHVPADRRRLLPVTPVERQRGAVDVGIPGHAGGPSQLRRRLDRGPVAAVKLASGCDRRCSFCAIPSFRGSFVSRTPEDLLAEAEWLARNGVRELHLVSENSTSYGKDLGDLRLLESLLPQLAAVAGIVRVRVAYLQPAELRPSLLATIAGTEGVAPYFDLSFQHASGPVLRRMRRFGDRESFLRLLDEVRAVAPEAGARSNVIVGFPGETDDDLAELQQFLEAARLDAIGVFGYSDEDGTEAAEYDDKVAEDVIAHRLATTGDLAEALTAERAEARVGELVDVLVEDVDGWSAEGRAAHQAPEVDGSTTVTGPGLRVGDLVRAKVTDSIGVDLVGQVVEVLSPAGAA
ncbi:MAG: ribosomal protein methylthiotransferase [Frankiales bacterium]|jgi:ribosomal protein S12 methylthiotransferase RimO|nr:ribosomal protein methylthiotransferase [Frankiales bacterium]